MSDAVWTQVGHIAILIGVLADLAFLWGLHRQLHSHVKEHGHHGPRQEDSDA